MIIQTWIIHREIKATAYDNKAILNRNIVFRYTNIQHIDFDSLIYSENMPKSLVLIK